MCVDYVWLRVQDLLTKSIAKSICQHYILFTIPITIMQDIFQWLWKCEWWSFSFYSADEPLQKSKHIPKGGLFVIGEEQDKYGGDFTPKESFFGDLSQLNIWDRELLADEIYDLANSCGHTQGNVLAWSDFHSRTTGNVKKTVPSMACDCASIFVYLR